MDRLLRGVCSVSVFPYTYIWPYGNKNEKRTGQALSEIEAKI